jgi:hypothetical protein
MISEETHIKKVYLFREIKGLDANIRTIEPKTKDFNKFVVEVGLFESLGEQGGDILTLTYEEFPTQEEIKQEVEENLKETYEDLINTIPNAREEEQIRVLKQILSKGNKILMIVNSKYGLMKVYGISKGKNKETKGYYHGEIKEGHYKNMGLAEKIEDCQIIEDFRGNLKK